MPHPAAITARDTWPSGWPRCTARGAASGWLGPTTPMVAPWPRCACRCRRIRSSRPSQPLAASHPNPTRPPDRMPTALIAEDEPLLAAALQADLVRLWPALQIVAVVGDGLSAAAQALALQPQLCFLDIRMPGASGLEAAQALAEDWPDHRPFPLLVFVTAYDQYALAAFEAQAVDYLVKPVDAARLGACVARLQRRLADQAGAPGAADPPPSSLGIAPL